MKRDIQDTDHESFRDSVRSLLDREVKPRCDSYIEARPSRAGPRRSPCGEGRPHVFRHLT
jgi:hypothetical protein